MEYFSAMKMSAEWRFDLAGILFKALGNAATGLANRQLLFGSKECNSEQMSLTLHSLTFVSTWQDNLDFLGDRLDLRRHAAIADPCVDTFKPLTLVRQTIVDVERALTNA